MAHRGDPAHSVNNVFFRGESDWITYHTVVSTSSDQIAIAPGYLQRQWQADGRNFFEYSMGSTPILDFFAYLSGRYQIQGDLSRDWRRRIARVVLRSRAHLRPRRHARQLSRGAGLLSTRLQSLPVHAVPYPRISPLPHLRPIVSEHCPLLGGIGFIGRVKNPPTSTSPTSSPPMNSAINGGLISSSAPMSKVQT